MDALTASYYDKNTPSLASRYEMANMDYTHRNLLRHLPEGGKILEIGCGSCRDAAFLLNHGFDVTAVDASSEMLSKAVARHPELAGRTYLASIPFSEENLILDRGPGFCWVPGFWGQVYFLGMTSREECQRS